MKLNKISFVPVLNGSILNCALREDLNLNGKRMTFYTKDAIFSYKCFLTNPYHHSDIWQKIKEKGLIPEDAICWADSGGLQAVNLGEVKHTPEEVYKWQQKYSNIGFSMDDIPFMNETGRFTGWVFDKANFVKHAQQSKENIEACKKYKDPNNKNFMFYGIIQGRKYDEYLKWYEIIRDDFIDGYCVKTPNNNPMCLAETIIFVKNNITKPVHFLGVGNQSKSLLVYYANQFLPQPISMDSSSYDIGTQFRSYLLPFMMNRKIRFVSEKNLSNDELCDKHSIVRINDLRDICDCPICQAIGNKVMKMVDDNDPILGSAISVHNLIMNIRWNNYIQSIVGNREKLLEFIRFNFEDSLADKMIKAIDMMDLANEKGYAYALDKYKDEIDFNKSVGEQKNIFNF